ncbi:TPA: hypothetical protein ACFP4Y_001045 [Neisseria bacilliformis]|uniref:hypothetical protein n=1 Tax=Neisseria bacilliformis TaxID=267212 RepID=UPI0013648FD0|nr:hypothetical protein [Neisseria bacilliformis]
MPDLPAANPNRLRGAPHTLPERQRPSENPFYRFSDGLSALSGGHLALSRR